MTSLLRNTLYLALAGTLASCAVDAGPERDYNDNPPLANLDELLADAPSEDEIPADDLKTDDVDLPESFTDLLGSQSAVKSQQSRGVCSIFSTVALMEHLYILEGTLSDPDFSEQYLQWSAKFEVGSFPNSSGSNANYNLQAVSRFGIVDEATMPYEGTQWDVSDDPECDGEDDQPTFCYTNGHPSDEVKAGKKYFLPEADWHSRYRIKQHMFEKGSGVVVGLQFFYQSWNHRKSDLGRNMKSWDKGFVNYPTPEDKKLSGEKRAGHSILLVGWDDNLEMPVPDADGNPQVDDNGDIVTEKGCYIFKNSWGTEGFGINSDWGPGYGCISYKYVESYASAQVAGLPSGVTPDDGETKVFEGEGGLDIPDADPTGISSTITIGESGTIDSLSINLDIEHSYKGDLRVTLYRGDQAVVVHNRSGGSIDDLVLERVIEEFNGTELAGEYRLVVVDLAGADTGTLNSWSLSATYK